MKKRHFLNKNLYKILFIRPDGKRALIDFTESGRPIRERFVPEPRIRKIFRTDLGRIAINPEIQKKLAQSGASRKSDTVLTRNSFFNVLVSVFSLKNIELKIALISFAAVVILALGPANKRSANTNLNPSPWADSLRDSSNLHELLNVDSTSKVEE
jgi:hypothetical protein